jgi:hypothetical protein
MIRSNDFFCVPDCACGSASPYTEAESQLSIQISNDADDRSSSALVGIPWFKLIFANNSNVSLNKL